MEKFLYYLIHLGVPLGIFWALWSSHPKSKISFLVGKIFQIACLALLFQWGQYPLVGSYYLRYLLIVIALFTFFVGWQRWPAGLANLPKEWSQLTILVVLSMSTSFLLYFNVLAFTGLTRKVVAMGDIGFPLKHGTYYISSGGTKTIVNNHFRDYPNSQQFAIDINRLNHYGAASSSFISNASEDHLIFGQDVYCPCTGVVTDMQDGVGDNATVNMQVNHKFGRGNYIELDCKGILVSLYHLKDQSILVTPGDLVRRDQLIGKVGNSGFSMEPHLHIHAALYNEDSLLVGIPVKFDNKWLVRNALVNLRE